MEINAVSNMSNGGNYTQSTVAKVTETSQPQIELPKGDIATDTQKADVSDKKELNSDQEHEVSAEMNKFMRMLDSNIRFVLHEKTNIRMVQVVDNKDNTVLKEFPSHELLDMKAKIREYVGILLDRHI